MLKIDIIATIIAGVVSGIISSVFFYQILKHIKPKIKISPYICMEDSGSGKIIYRTKFVNLSKKVITNLDYVLQYLIIEKDSVHTIKEISPCKLKLKIISKYDRRDEDARYAVRISYEIPEMSSLKGDNVRWLFTVIAEDPASGATTCVTQEFKAKDIVWGKHETKESLLYVATRESSVPTYTNV